MARDQGFRFKRGYVCKICVEESFIRCWDDVEDWMRATMPPLYLRVDGKFTYADLVICPQHGVTAGMSKLDAEGILRRKLREEELSYKPWR